MSKRFQGEIEHALTKYALIPVIVLAVFGMSLLLISWEHYVTGINHERRALVADVLAGIAADYQAKTEKAIGECQNSWSKLNDAGTRAKIFSDLYSAVNVTHDGTDFYVLDAAGNIKISNKGSLPTALNPLTADFGVIKRLANSAAVYTEFIAGDDKNSYDLLVGSRLGEGENILGYVFFIIHSSYLTHNIDAGRLDFILADSFANARLTTGANYALDNYKVSFKFLAAQNSLVTADKHIYYVSQERLTIGNEDYTLYALSPATELIERYLLGLALVIAAMLLMLPIIVVSARRESLLRTKAIEGLSAVAEVRQLESQFNPHFLFNTLENIKFMIKLDSNAAIKMIVALSSILRYSINNENLKVTLASDLEYLHSYMQIQQARFGKRLLYEEDIATDLLAAVVPKLIFQPLLENAIKYGESADGSINIKLSVCAVKNDLCVTISDKGTGLDAAKLNNILAMLEEKTAVTTHTGIYNVHRRLRLLYGEPYGVNVDSTAAAGTTITIKLPLTKMEN